MGMPGWSKSNRANPCPICKRTDSSCRISPDGEVCLCLRIESGCMTHKDGTKVAAKGGMGFYHRLGQAKHNGNGYHAKPKIVEKKLTTTEIRSILKECDEKLTDERLKAVKEMLGVSIEALKTFGCGYHVRSGYYSFPMFNGKMQPCGIRLRSADGEIKRSVIGSSNGIFVPSNYATAIECKDFLDASPQLILLPEGPTDCMALYDLGFRAIGRPSNMGGSDEIRDLLKSESKQDVVIVADNDKTKWTPTGIPFVPGWEGALHLADAIIRYCGTLKIVRPPGDAKDARKFYNGGGSAAMIESLIAQADQVTRVLLNEKMRAMVIWKSSGQKSFLARRPT